MKTITTLSLLCLAVVQINASQLPFTPNRNISGVVSEVSFSPEVIKDTYFDQDIKTSEYYSLNLTNVVIELSNPNDSLAFPTIATGDFDTYNLRLTPTPEIESLNVGDTVFIEEYSTGGDEFSQTYSYSFIDIHPKTTAILNSKGENAISSQSKIAKVNGVNKKIEINTGYTYYNLLGKNISNTSYTNRSQIIMIQRMSDK